MAGTEEEAFALPAKFSPSEKNVLFVGKFSYTK